jgi:hypothetical protein
MAEGFADPSQNCAATLLEIQPVSLVAHDRRQPPRGTTRLIRTGIAAVTAIQQATLPI